MLEQVPSNNTSTMFVCCFFQVEDTKKYFCDECKLAGHVSEADLAAEKKHQEKRQRARERKARKERAEGAGKGPRRTDEQQSRKPKSRISSYFRAGGDRFARRSGSSPRKRGSKRSSCRDIASVFPSFRPDTLQNKAERHETRFALFVVLFTRGRVFLKHFVLAEWK